ncbi:hypothetical protein [Massilia sp. CFBP9026]|nr:hypothetical protein [Massilia sp. CFBP9026]MDY0961725.1 hypothetical protein [Massilia sp. CFBP9026]
MQAKINTGIAFYAKRMNLSSATPEPSSRAEPHIPHIGAAVQ